MISRVVIETLQVKVLLSTVTVQDLLPGSGARYSQTVSSKGLQRFSVTWLRSLKVTPSCLLQRLGWRCCGTDVSWWLWCMRTDERICITHPHHLQWYSCECLLSFLWVQRVKVFFAVQPIGEASSSSDLHKHDVTLQVQFGLYHESVGMNGCWWGIELVCREKQHSITRTYTQRGETCTFHSLA